VSRSRSSIFSFDTLRLNGRAPTGFFRAVLLALALSIAAEGAARMVIPAEGPRDEYWSRGAAAKFETYRERADAGSPPAVLVVGDSTAARDFDPAAIAEVLPPGFDAYNLAWPGNFPLAFRCTTIPLLASAASVPRVVVAAFTPNGFSDTERVQRFEAGIMTSDICRRAEGARIPADFLRLTLLGRALSRGDATEPDMAATELGFMPLAGRSQERSRREDRARREKDDVRSITAERFEVVRELGRIARERGFALVVVVPPVAPKERDGNVYAEYTRALAHSSAELGFTVIDWRHPEGYDRDAFYDPVHLNAEAARRFSRELGRVVHETMSR
jgi:hypothetical protein